MKKHLKFLLIMTALLVTTLAASPAALAIGPAPYARLGARAEQPAAEAPINDVRYDRVPILMYHVLGENDGPNKSLYLSPAHFQQHLDYFAEQGITPVTMAQLYAHYNNDVPLPEKPIVLTFDDGYRSMYTEAWPRLHAKGWPATFFVYTNFIGGKSGLTAEMLAEMAAGGMEFGSHTVSHQRLTTLTAKSLVRELDDSRATLQRLTGQSIDFLCYPVGYHNAQVRQAAQDAGYAAAVTTTYGFTDRDENYYQWDRIRISRGDDAAALSRKLAKLGY